MCRLVALVRFITFIALLSGLEGGGGGGGGGGLSDLKLVMRSRILSQLSSSPMLFYSHRLLLSSCVSIFLQIKAEVVRNFDWNIILIYLNNASNLGPK